MNSMSICHYLGIVNYMINMTYLHPLSIKDIVAKLCVEIYHNRICPCERKQLHYSTWRNRTSLMSHRITLQFFSNAFLYPLLHMFFICLIFTKLIIVLNLYQRLVTPPQGLRKDFHSALCRLLKDFTLLSV